MYEKVLSALQAQLQNSRQPRLRRSTWSDQGDENDSHLVSSLAVDLGASHHRDFAASLKYERHSTDLISEGWSTGDIHDHLLARAFDSVTARPWDSIVIPLLWDQIVAPLTTLSGKRAVG